VIDLLLQLECGKTQEELATMPWEELQKLCDQVLQSSTDLYRLYVRAVHNVRVHISNLMWDSAFYLLVWVWVGQLVCYLTLSFALDRFLQDTQNAGNVLVVQNGVQKPFDIAPYTDFRNKRISAPELKELLAQSRALAAQIQECCVPPSSCPIGTTVQPPLLAPSSDAPENEWTAFYTHCGEMYMEVLLKGEFPPITPQTAKLIAQHLRGLRPDNPVFREQIAGLLQLSRPGPTFPGDNYEKIAGLTCACLIAATAVPDDDTANELVDIAKNLQLAFPTKKNPSPDHVWPIRLKNYPGKLIGKIAQPVVKNSPSPSQDNRASVQQQAIMTHPEYPFMQYKGKWPAFVEAFSANFPVYASDGTALKLFQAEFSSFSKDMTVSWLRIFVQGRIKEYHTAPDSNTLSQVRAALELLLTNANWDGDVSGLWDLLPDNFDDMIAGLELNEGRYSFIAQCTLLEWGLIKHLSKKPFTHTEEKTLALISIDPSNGVYPQVCNLPHEDDPLNKFNIYENPNIPAYYRDYGIICPRAFECISCVSRPFDFISRDEFEKLELSMPPGVKIDWTNGVLINSDGSAYISTNALPIDIANAMTDLIYTRKHLSESGHSANMDAIVPFGTEIIIDGRTSIDMRTGQMQHQKLGRCVAIPYSYLGAGRQIGFCGGGAITICSNVDFNDEMLVVANGKIVSPDRQYEMVCLDNDARVRETVCEKLGIDLPTGAWIAVDPEGNIREIVYINTPVYEYADATGRMRYANFHFIQNHNTGKMELYVGGQKTNEVLVSHELVRLSAPGQDWSSSTILMEENGQFSIRRHSSKYPLFIDRNNGFVMPALENRWLFNSPLNMMCLPSSDANNPQIKLQFKSVISTVKSYICNGDLSVWFRFYGSSDEQVMDPELETIKKLLELYLYAMRSNDIEFAILCAQAFVAILAVERPGDVCAKKFKELIQKNKSTVLAIWRQAIAAQSSFEDAVILDAFTDQLNIYLGLKFRYRNPLFGERLQKKQFEVRLRITPVHESSLLRKRPPVLDADSFPPISYETRENKPDDLITSAEWVSVDGNRLNFAQLGVPALNLIAPVRSIGDFSDASADHPPVSEEEGLSESETAQDVVAWRRQQSGKKLLHADVCWKSFLDTCGLSAYLASQGHLERLPEEKVVQLQEHLNKAQGLINDDCEKAEACMNEMTKIINGTFGCLTAEAKQKSILGRYEVPTLDELTICALRGFDHKHQCQGVDNFIKLCTKRFGLLYTRVDATRVLSALECYMGAKTALDECKRRMDGFQKFKDCLLQNLGDSNGGSILAVRESFGTWVQLTSSARAYNPKREPFFLIFEHLSGLRMRPEQVRILRKLYRSITTKSGTQDMVAFLYEMMMGAGKTSVINIILAEILCGHGKIPLFLNHQALHDTMVRDLSKYSQSRHRKDVIEISLSQGELSSSKHIQEILKKFKTAKRDGTYIAMTNTSARLIRIMLRKRMARLVESTSASAEREEIRESHNVMEGLCELLTFIEMNCGIINDEADINLDPTFSLNIPHGAKKGFTDLQREMLTSIFKVIYADRELLQVIENGAGFSDANLENIVEKTFAIMGIDRNDRHYGLYRWYVLFDEEAKQRHENEDRLRRLWEAERTRLAAENSDLLERLALFRGELYVLWAASRNALNREYGFRLDDLPTPGASRSIGAVPRAKGKTPNVVPFAAANTPSLGSYAHPLERITYAVFAYMQTPVPKNREDPTPVAMAVKLFIKDAFEHPKSIQAKYLANKFGGEKWKELIENYADPQKCDGIIGAAFNKCKELFANNDERVGLIMMLVHNASAVYPSMIEGTAYLQANMSRWGIGCSGTLWNRDVFASTFQRGQQSVDETIKIRIAEKMDRDVRSGAASVMTMPLQNEDPVSALLGLRGDKERYCAIMDAAGSLKDFSGLDVARRARKIHTQGGNAPYGAYVFYSKEKELGKEGWYILCGTEVKFLPNNNPETIAAVTGGLTREEIFVFFDQSHCVGVDLPLPRAGRSVVTVCPHKTTISQALQAILRARGFFDHQTVDVCLTEGLQLRCGVFSLFDRLSNNEKNVLEMHRIHNTTAELMEVARRTMEEKANWFYRMFRWLIIYCGNLPILSWFHRHWIWLLGGCVEFAVTCAPFDPSAWYGQLKEEAKAADVVGRLQRTIGEKLRPYGASEPFFRETDEIVRAAQKQFGGTSVHVFPENSTQVGTQTEIQVETETEQEQQQTPVSSQRGDPEREKPLSCASTERLSAGFDFLCGMLGAFSTGNSQDTIEKIKRASARGSTKQRLFEEISCRMTPTFGKEGLESRCQIPERWFGQCLHEAVLAQVPRETFESAVEDFLGAIAAIYEKAKLREKTQGNSTQPPFGPAGPPFSDDSEYWETVGKNFDEGTRDALIAIVTEFDKKIGELCSHTKKYTTLAESEGRKLVNRIETEDLFDSDHLEVLINAVTEEWLSNRQQIFLILIPLFRILLQDCNKVSSVSEVFAMITSRFPKFKDKIAPEEKEALKEWVDGAARDWLKAYFQDDSVDVICLVAKTLLELAIPPRPEDAAEKLAKMALGSATGPVKRNGSSSVADVAATLFGSEFDPTKPQNTGAALKLISLGGLLSTHLQTLKGCGGVVKDVVELFEQTRREIVKLGGRTLDALKVYDGDQVVDAGAGVSPVNAWLQEYWPGFRSIFPGDFFATWPFVHAFGGDNDPTTPNVRNIQYMLIYRKRDGSIGCLLLTSAEVEEFGNLINSGNLTGARIYSVLGERDETYRCPGEPEKGPENDPDRGAALRATNEKAQEFAFWAQVFNGTLTPEFLRKNPKVVPLYHQMISGTNGGRECCEKFMEKSRQDPSWLSSPIAFAPAA
jgi:hypothetical protein